jgi:hypothetical protein
MNNNIRLLIDFGLQPISNRYTADPNQKDELYPLKFGQCQQTGLLQLIEPLNQEELIPRHDWISYNEPEAHLDQLVARLFSTYLSKKNPIIGGVSFKDDTTLKRFEKFGCKTWSIDPIRDLKLSKDAGVESVQSALDPFNAKQIANQNGKVDLLVVRHIWEHVYKQDLFLEALKLLVAEDGYILFEVPDSSNQLSNIDYTMVWEEHLFYYTDYTFKSSLQNFGFNVIELETISYQFENSLVALVKNDDIKGLDNNSEDYLLNEALLQGKIYGEKFKSIKDFIIKFFNEESNNQDIMLFGGGHHANAFINYFSLEDSISCVIDDDPNKQNLFMPKSKLPIKSSTVLLNKGKFLLVFSLMPEHEKKIIEKHNGLLKKNSQLSSIFPSSKYSFIKNI